MNDLKILIIGHSFNQNSSDGITISNLFTDWNPDNIALVSSRININWAICKKQYLIGHDETTKPWPFSLLQDQMPSAIISKEISFQIESGSPQIKKNILDNSKLSSRQNIRNITKKVLNYFGIFLFFSKINLSKNLCQFIEDFQPDLIYSQLESLEIIHFIEKIHDLYHIPIAIHIMDDWPALINNSGLLGFYWNRKTHHALRNLISKSSVLMTISNNMSCEYERRYGGEWTSFHNPVETDFMLQINADRTSATKYNPNRLTYMGRIGNANERSLQYLINVVTNLNKQYPEVEFNIYSPNFENNKLKIKSQNNSIHILPAVPHKEVAKILKSSGLLILPLDFNKASRKFARYSMPTKASEYMASGVPVLIFAPSENAVTKYAREEEWGYVVDREDETLLQKAIAELLQNSDLRNKLIRNSLNLVAKNHDSMQVRIKFRETLQKAIKNHV